ncbi:MAG: phytanoyl-CoA dioxygenase family protein [Granulosicoccus sp.]|nr:phytanoyl-CoA dioxygenase family protein [Granulosicoccus sp.]
MKTLDADQFSPDAVVAELLKGSGAVRLPALFTPEQVAEVKQFIDEETAVAGETGSHFNKGNDDALLQRRVWNLLPRKQVFADMIQHPSIIDSMRAFLGTDFILGSYCASRTMPGFGGQQPHIDYPYWDFYRSNSFPAELNASFPLNCQATFIIDPFTEENGATAFWPGTYSPLAYPESGAKLPDNGIRMTGNPGDVVLFNGAAWHCAMPNNSNGGRIGLLIEFLPKFVKPIEDMLTGTDPDFLESANPLIRQLLGFDYPWPSAPPAPPISA